MILASHATSGGHRYDPSTRTVHLGDGASPYALAHERAHQAQHAYRTWFWRLNAALGSAPYLGRIARLACEWEAKRLAIRALELCGECDRHARADAREGLRSYIFALFLPWT